MPLVQTRGAASAQGFGEFAQASAPIYIEDVFSTFLYTGTGATATITNNIDLSTKGGLVWIKSRSAATVSKLTDTSRGVTKALITSTTAAQTTDTTGLTAFGTTGFTIGADSNYNTSAATYCSWTFRKQPKFFDVVTFTTEASNTNQRISHSLGSVPGMIIVKRTDGVDNWFVWHRSLSTATDNYLYLNSTIAEDTTSGAWGTTGPTSTDFGVDDTFFGGSRACVAYVFAHNAGGFGLTGTDNVVSCGSFTTDGSGNATVSLGYEPQWVLIKRSSGITEWWVTDNMRGFDASPGTDTKILQANSSGAEGTESSLNLNATGFTTTGTYTSSTFIYIAIRRGPMKVPTSGTSVLGLSARSGTGANATVTGGQTDDAVIVKNRGSAVAPLFSSRLTGTGYLVPSSTAAEVAAGVTILQANPWDVMDGVKVGTTSTITNASANTYINYLFKRAPSFFDVVCYKGTGTAGQTFNHNLSVVPEMMIVKNRTSGVQQWRIYHSFLGATKSLSFQGSAAATSTTIWNDTAPTSSVFSVGTAGSTNDNTSTFVAYLFATCAGVSKVGSYTGTATTLQIDCGFTAGARWIMIKRTDSTGDYYVWDTARGIVAGDDPYFLLNGTAAEVTNTDYIDTYSAGFELSSTAPAAINASGGTYIFLAIA